MALPRFDRWERLTLARGGNPKRRSGRHTKPGPRPRATPVVRACKTETKPKMNLDDWNKAFKAAAGYYNPTNQFKSIYQYQPYDTQPTGSNFWVSTWASAASTTTSASTLYIPTTFSNTSSSTLSYSTSNNIIYQTSYANDSTYDNSLTNPWSGIYRSAQQPDPAVQKELIDKYNKEQKKNQHQYKIRTQLIIKNPLNQKGIQVRAMGQPAQFDRVPPNELVALNLLKSMLQAFEWKRYLKYGFIVVRGQSGLSYQIVRGKSHVVVFSKGKKLAELCVMVNGNVPPTDAVVARKILVEIDEKDIWARANVHVPANVVHQMFGPQYRINPTDRQLQQLAAA